MANWTSPSPGPHQWLFAKGDRGNQGVEMGVDCVLCISVARAATTRAPLECELCFRWVCRCAGVFMAVRLNSTWFWG